MQATAQVEQGERQTRTWAGVLSRERVWDFTAVLLLISLPFIIFWAFWSPNLDDRMIMIGDALVGAYPTRVYVHRLLMAGEIPLWNPYQLGGMPLLGDIQAAVYYLPNLLLSAFYWGRDITFEGFEALVVSHYAIGAVLMYGYLRNLKLSRAAALVGAIAFEFNGFFIGHRGHYSMFSVVVWVPGILWLLDRAWFAASRWAGLRDAVLAGLLISQMVMGGHPQLTFYSTIFIGCYFLYRWAGVWRQERPFSQPRLRHPAVQMLIRFGLAGLLAASLSAIALLPMFELLGRSLRSEPTYAFAAQFPLMPRNIITLFIPEFLAWSGTEFRIYAGVLTLLLVLVATVVPTEARRERGFFLVTTAVSFTLALGGFTAVHAMLYRFVPGFDSVRVAARIFYFANISLAVLAAFGAQALLNQLDTAERERLNGLLQYGRSLLVGLGLIAVVFYLLLAWQYQPVEEDFYFYESLFVPSEGADRFHFLTQMINQYLLFVFFLGGGLLLFLLRLKNKLTPMLLTAALAGLMVLDLATFATSHDTVPSPGIDAVLFDEFEVIQLEPWRVQERDQLLDALSSLPPTVRVDNRDGVLPDNYSQLWQTSFSTGYNILDLQERFEIFTQWPYLDDATKRSLLGVGLIVTGAETAVPPEENVTLLIDNSVGKLWQRANPPQYAHFSTQMRPADPTLTTNGLLLAANGDLYRQPVVQSDQADLRRTLQASWPEAVDDGLYRVGETAVISPVDISVLASGIDGYSSIVVDGVTVTPQQRGLIVATVDPASGDVRQTAAFDTYLSAQQSGRFAAFINAVPNGTIVAVASYDEAARSLTDEAQLALASLGAAQTLIGQFGQAYALVGVKGSDVGTAVEAISPTPVTVDVGIGAYQPAADSTFSYVVNQYSQDEIRLFVKNGETGLLTVSETVFPGWRAFVNGEPVPILRSNGMFRSVVLPPSAAGQPNEVVFIFDSALVRYSQTLSALGIAASLFLLVWFSWFRQKERTRRD